MATIFLSLAPQLHHGVAEDGSVGRRGSLAPLRLAGLQVKGADAVELARVFLRRPVSLPFGGHHMDEDRAFQGTDILQDFQKLGQVVPLDRTDIVETERLEE